MSTTNVEAPATVTCDCGLPMILRTAQRGPRPGSQFYGCSGFPTCRNTKPYPPAPTPTTPTTNPPPDSLLAVLQGVARNSPPVQSGGRPALTPSAQQQVFLNTLVNEDCHIVLAALAGTGKTTTCEMGYNALKAKNPLISIGYMAFNAHNAEEFRNRGINGCTFHSMGRAAVDAAYGPTPVDSKGVKVSTIINEVWPKSKQIDDATERAITAIISHLKANLQWGTKEEINEHIARHEIEVAPDDRATILRVVPLIMKMCQERTSVQDFDDMIWLPIVNNLPIKQYDVLMVDESQDMNRARMELALRAGKRLVVVGDSNQAIYGFTGADTRSMDTFGELLEARSDFPIKVLPLSVTRRCPKAIVELARTIVPTYEAHESAPEGAVRHCDLGTFHDLIEADSTDLMILCRTVAPLVREAYKLIELGVKCYIRNKDVGAGLKALVKRLRARSLPDLSKKLNEYADAEFMRLMQLDSGGMAIANLQDRVEVMTILINASADLTDLVRRIDDMFKPSKDAILLSSIHSSKGLEAKRVAIIRPELLPHPRAEQGWQQQQERNLQYVAYTRAKDTLYIVSDTGE